MAGLDVDDGEGVGPGQGEGRVVMPGSTADGSGPSTRRVTPELLKRMLDMQRRGMTHAAIADRLGLSGQVPQHLEHLERNAVASATTSSTSKPDICSAQHQ